MSIDKLAHLLLERINAEYGDRCAALGAVAGTDPIKDAVARGGIQTIKEFQQWIDQAVRQINGIAPDPEDTSVEDHYGLGASPAAEVEEEIDAAHKIIKEFGQPFSPPPVQPRSRKPRNKK